METKSQKNYYDMGYYDELHNRKIPVFLKKSQEEEYYKGRKDARVDKLISKKYETNSYYVLFSSTIGTSLLSMN